MDRADIQESGRFLSSDKSAFYTFLSQKIRNLSNLQLKIGNFATLLKLPIYMLFCLFLTVNYSNL